MTHCCANYWQIPELVNTVQFASQEVLLVNSECLLFVLVLIL